MLIPSTRPGRWSLILGALMALLGFALLVLPVGGPEGVQLTGYILMAAAVLEAAAGLKSSRNVRVIELLLSAVAFGAAMFILLRPSLYPLTFVAILCLAVRGVGAVIAGAFSGGSVGRWVIARGAFDLALMVILLVGAPFSAAVSVISGVALTGERWPANGDIILVNFVAASIFVTGLCLVSIGLTRSRQAGDLAPTREP
jgi:hypothetical protein